MAHSKGDFFAGEELDDLFFLLDAGFLDGDADLNMEVDAIVSEVAADSSHPLFNVTNATKLANLRED